MSAGKSSMRHHSSPLSQIIDQTMKQYGNPRKNPGAAGIHASSSSSHSSPMKVPVMITHSGSHRRAVRLSENDDDDDDDDYSSECDDTCSENSTEEDLDCSDDITQDSDDDDESEITSPPKVEVIKKGREQSPSKQERMAIRARLATMSESEKQQLMTSVKFGTTPEPAPECTPTPPSPPDVSVDTVSPENVVVGEKSFRPTWRRVTSSMAHTNRVGGIVDSTVEFGKYLKKMERFNRRELEDETTSSCDDEESDDDDIDAITSDSDDGGDIIHIQHHFSEELVQCFDAIVWRISVIIIMFILFMGMATSPQVQSMLINR